MPQTVYSAEKEDIVHSGFTFPPVQNGVDYLHSVVEHLSGDPTDRDLKYAVLHLQAATEVLLKVRLTREHWSLVFRNPDKATRVAYEGGDFLSVGVEETLARLKGIAGIDLPEETRRSFDRLAKERNKLQHFGLEAQTTAAIESIIGSVLDALLVFISQHLQPGAEDAEQEAYADALETIREEIARISVLVNARNSRISPLLDAKTCDVVKCPECLQDALPLDEELLCLFCEHNWEPAKLASEYASEVLGITWHDVVKGADEPVVSCPECDMETAVYGVTTREHGNQVFWACFGCRITFGRDAVDSCMRCGTMMWSDDDGMTVCGSCFEDVVSSD